jgi:SAM-dependent methyltransferase
VNRLVRKLQWSLQHRGLAGTLDAASITIQRRLRPAPEITPHPFDTAHGTDTGGLISGAELASGRSNDRFITGYAAVPPSRFRGILERWQASDPAHAIGEYCFVDLGCGKGRAVLLASEAGFREAMGVELNPALAMIAQANADGWTAAGKGHCPVRIQQADALEFEWPSGACVGFLFNPIGGGLMEQLANRMAAVFRDRPSDLEVLYYKPEQADAFADHFEMIWCETTGISPEDLAVDPVAAPGDETRAYRLSRR